MVEIVLVLADIRSTHNVGSILRSANGFAVKKVYYTGYTPYPLQKNDSRLPHESSKLTSQIAKTALGAENIDSEIVQDINLLLTKLKSTGYDIVCLEQSEKSIKLNEFNPTNKIALILGNEVDGVNAEILEKSDYILEIPMFGTKESYNVSVAAAIALYQLRVAG